MSEQPTLADILAAIERLTDSVDALHASFKAAYGGIDNRHEWCLMRHNEVGQPVYQLHVDGNPVGQEVVVDQYGAPRV